MLSEKSVPDKQSTDGKMKYWVVSQRKF